VSTERLVLHRHFLPSLAAFVFLTVLAGWGAGSTQKHVPERMGQVVDWSTRHVLYSQGASLRALALSQHDPRAYWNYLRLTQAASEMGRQAAFARFGRPRRPRPSHTDWSVSLGAAGTAPNMFPAKFSFDVKATPDCTKDYVVFTINHVPGAAQANIAAFNNLYSGASSTSCGVLTAATVTWAYRVAATRVRTSPIISLDGTKVAFLDGANPAVFHVLTPAAGQGTVTVPATPTVAELASVALTTGADSDSSPFMDYYNDIAYVGTNNGRVFKITGVFRGTPTLAGAPWPLTAGATTLTGPVIDFSTGNIFVGSANGDLYGFSSAGAAIPSSPLIVGSGGANGGIADSPIVDVVSGRLYVATGENSALTAAVVEQTSTSSFATVQTATIGTNNLVPIHAGTFNDAYFSVSTNMIGTTSEWFFYVCGVATGGATSPVLYRASFNGSRVMNAAVNATNVSLSANNGEACSPITEFKNGVDRLFLGLLTSAQVEFFDISTTTTPTLGGTGAVAPVAEPGGTSGIIVDNVSAIAQASSIYFTTQRNSANCGTHRCAVKLTQGGLQ
jgi:hypothetical protein